MVGLLTGKNRGVGRTDWPIGCGAAGGAGGIRSARRETHRGRGAGTREKLPRSLPGGGGTGRACDRRRRKSVLGFFPAKQRTGRAICGAPLSPHSSSLAASLIF